MIYRRPTEISAKGLKFIGHFEGLALHPYNDVADNATIGYGHLLHKGPVTKLDQMRYFDFTLEEALRTLRMDAQAADWAVTAAVKAKINQAQHDALVSFVFNLGVGTFERSLLLKELNRHAGTVLGVIGKKAKLEVQQNLLLYVHAGGKVVPGLVNRRKAEAALFCNGKYVS